MRYHGQFKAPGGKLVVAEFDVADGQLANVRITGDFFLFPDDAIHVIANSLNGATIDDDWAERIRRAIGPDVEMLGFGPDDVAAAIRRALA